MVKTLVKVEQSRKMGRDPNATNLIDLARRRMASAQARESLFKPVKVHKSEGTHWFVLLWAGYTAQE